MSDQKQFSLGFDQAIVNTGIGILSVDNTVNKLKYEHSELFSSKFTWGAKSDAYILLEQGAYLKKILNKWSEEGDIKSICIEGVAFGSPGGASSRGAIFGLFITTCLRYSDVLVVPPMSMKKFVTNDGHAKKDAIKAVIHPRYNLKDLKRKIWDDEHDALGLAEMGYYAWKIIYEGAGSIKKELQPYQLDVLWNETLNVNKLPKGLCNRVDEFYLRRVQSA
jgi:Holliday junction resolvasome RuvABC endonuclease subunit